MENHSYLPAMQEKNDFGNLTPPGVLLAQSNKRLKDLADAIVVTKVAQEPGKVHKLHSIPNPWARAIVFGLALHEPKHLLHEQTVGEWRGLLALLALREVRRMHGLSFQSVSLKNAQTGSFAAVLSELKPKGRWLITPETTWNDFHLFRWDKNGPAGVEKHVIGFESPMTLVATAAEYKDSIDKSIVPWFDGAILRDPVRYLMPKEKTSLAEWVTYVLSRVTDQKAGEDPTRKSEMIDRLKEFLVAIAAPVEAAKVASCLVVEEEKGWKANGLFRAINRPHNGESDLLTELEIRGSFDPQAQAKATNDNKPAGSAPPNRWVLIDPSVNREFEDRKTTEIVAYRSRSLETMLRQAQKKTWDRIDGDAIWGWCTKDYFFEDFLIYEQLFDEAPTPFPGCLPANDVTDRHKSSLSGHNTILFPLTEDATKLFSAEYLHKNFKVEWVSDNEAICSLTLTLKTVPKPGKDGGLDRIVILEKHYTKTGGEGNGWLEPYNATFPSVGIWPNFRSDDKGKNRWRSYYLFESWHRVVQDDPTEPLTDKFLVEPLSGGTLLQPKRTVNLADDKDKVTFHVQPLPDYPRFLRCSTTYSKSAPRVRNGKRPKALMLLSPPKEGTPSSPTETAVLGIDFGTTGTAIYYSKNKQNLDPKPMVFNDRYVPIMFNDDDRFPSLLRRMFIPSASWDGARKILSVLQEFPQEQELSERSAVRDSHVMYADPANSLVDNDGSKYYLGAPSTIVSNLKWGGRHKATVDFLTQICIQSLAELVFAGAGKVEIRCSSPTALKGKGRVSSQTNWDNIKEKLQGTEGHLNPITSVPVEFDYDILGKPVAEQRNYEALAATRFFSKVGKPALSAGSGAITFDIGGGTTDLAIWSRPDKEAQLVGHLSVLFAGRNIFRKPVLRNPIILDVIMDNPKLFSFEGSEESAKWAKLDAIISAHGETLIKHLSAAISGKAKKSVNEFLNILELGLCGLAFYSGLLVGELIAKGRYIPKAELLVYVGGNGSKLLQWCDLGSFSDGSAMHKRFADSLLAGVRLADPEPERQTRVRISISKQPKEEVAYGLVASGEDFRIENAFKDPVEGEGFEVEGGQRPWKESIKDEDLLVTPLHLQVDEHMPVFKAFLVSLDPETRKVDLDDAYLEHMANSLAGELRAKGGEMRRAKDAEQELIEDRVPLFFMALNRLIEERVDRWMEIKVDAN